MPRSIDANTSANPLQQSSFPREILPDNPLQHSQADGSVQSSTSSGPQVPMDGNGETIQERIRQRAYELYEERGSIDGYEMEDWIQAESEVLGRSRRDRAA